MSKTLVAQDFQKAATTLGCELASVYAVKEVESKGSGFLDTGEPVILFERHVFRKRLIALGINVDGLPSDIVNKDTGGYLGGLKEHTRLGRAVEINRNAALESCSWGLFQVMGYHWKALGYGSLQEFINAMYTSEAGQLEAFVRYVALDRNLVKALKNRDWATFAAGYNGPGYAKNSYDEKLAAAYKKWNK